MHQQRTSYQSSQRAGAVEEAHFYRLLGVSETATSDQIKRGYRAAMKRIHPDKVSPELRDSAENEAKAVNLAFRTLSDPALRRQYDAQRKSAAVQDQIMSRYFGGFGAPGSSNDLYDQIMQAAQDEQRKLRKQHDRSAAASLLVVFVGLLVAVVAAVLSWGIFSALAGNLF